jgi:hypothetical protein
VPETDWQGEEKRKIMQYVRTHARTHARLLPKYNRLGRCRDLVVGRVRVSSTDKDR